jgi:hypothetical protein
LVLKIFGEHNTASQVLKNPTLVGIFVVFLRKILHGILFLVRAIYNGQPIPRDYETPVESIQLLD